jgi:hypothetical protein
VHWDLVWGDKRVEGIVSSARAGGYMGCNKDKDSPQEVVNLLTEGGASNELLTAAVYPCLENLTIRTIISPRDEKKLYQSLH